MSAYALPKQSAYIIYKKLEIQLVKTLLRLPLTEMFPGLYVVIAVEFNSTLEHKPG